MAYTHTADTEFVSTRILTTGDRVDGYTVGELLHEGGMARLYHARHENMPEPLVLKVPKLDTLSANAAYISFENEMRLLSRLRYSFLPKHYAHGDMLHCPYIVMEYIQGDLLQQATRRAPITVEELCPLMEPVCKAVHELHRHNVIHLDLKPENVRNRSDASVVLIDFGSAHHSYWPDMLDVPSVDTPTTDATVAPEQLHNVRHDSRSDLYAIGVILYRLATGRLPFGDRHATRRLYVPPCPPSVWRPDIPAWLQEIILRCLEVHPNQRYGSAKEIAYALSHPQSVAITQRGLRSRPIGFFERVRYFLRHFHLRFDDLVQQSPHERLLKHPHILLALDLQHTSANLKTALRTAITRLARSEPGSVFTCLTVASDSDLLNEDDISSAGDYNNPAFARDVEHQLQLRHFLEPLKLRQQRVHFQVLRGDAVNVILAYAKHHVVDQVLLGATKTLGKVASRIISDAPCSVTVVRTRKDVDSM